MNAPAKQYSLQHLFPTPAEGPPRGEAHSSVPLIVTPAMDPTPFTAVPPAPPRGTPKAPPVREARPKKKRSYSVDAQLCTDLEVLAWYQSRSSSSVVEDLIRKYLGQNRALLAKAREVQADR